MEHLDHPSPHWFQWCQNGAFLAPSRLHHCFGGGWGIIVPFYTVQDCSLSYEFWVLVRVMSYPHRQRTCKLILICATRVLQWVVLLHTIVKEAKHRDRYIINQADRKTLPLANNFLFPVWSKNRDWIETNHYYHDVCLNSRHHNCFFGNQQCGCLTNGFKVQTVFVNICSVLYGYLRERARWTKSGAVIGYLSGQDGAYTTHRAQRKKAKY